MPAYLASRPAAGRISEGFGWREVLPTPTSPRIHYGQDYGWGGGDTIRAARAGRVTSYAYSGAYGNRLVIDHGNGIQTWYCHTARALVAVGATVAAGAAVAMMGATGNVTAKHLHFELRIDGVATDPEPYFATTTLAADLAAALLDSAPAPRKWPTMKLKYDTGGVGFLITEEGVTGLSGQEANLVERVANAAAVGTPTTDPFLRGEFYILDDAIKRAARGPRNF